VSDDIVGQQCTGNEKIDTDADDKIAARHMCIILFNKVKQNY